MGWGPSPLIAPPCPTHFPPAEPSLLWPLALLSPSPILIRCASGTSPRTSLVPWFSDQNNISKQANQTNS